MSEEFKGIREAFQKYRMAPRLYDDVIHLGYDFCFHLPGGAREIYHVKYEKLQEISDGLSGDAQILFDAVFGIARYK